MIQYERYPLNLTKFKTNNYRPKDHFRVPLRWDNFTMHIPIWNQVLSHFFRDKKDLKILELGSGNGLCSNFLLDNYPCYIETVDLSDSHIWEEEGEKYIVSTTSNLQPFIEEGRCNFYQTSTKNFLLKNQDKKYDFIYIDASHDADWVLYDAVNSFPLLKENGLIIFDDYGMHNCAKGINAFLSCFEPYLKVFHKDWQLMIHKISEFQDDNEKKIKKINTL